MSIKHNGRTVYIIKTLGIEMSQFPADFADSPIRNILAQMERIGEDYDKEEVRGGDKKPDSRDL